VRSWLIMDDRHSPCVVAPLMVHVWLLDGPGRDGASGFRSHGLPPQAAWNSKPARPTSLATVGTHAAAGSLGDRLADVAACDIDPDGPWPADRFGAELLGESRAERLGELTIGLACTSERFSSASSISATTSPLVTELLGPSRSDPVWAACVGLPSTTRGTRIRVQSMSWVP
jgi:hypothetical protein